MITYRLGKKGDEKEVLKVIGDALSKYGLGLEPDGADFDVSDIEKYYLNNSGWFEVVFFYVTYIKVCPIRFKT